VHDIDSGFIHQRARKSAVGRLDFEAPVSAPVDAGDHNIARPLQLCHACLQLDCPSGWFRSFIATVFGTARQQLCMVPC
jgi:hypothetical protein